MGEVYKARDSRLDRTVAIKVIGAGAGSDPVMRERLLREARAASSLNHPHICTVHDVHDGEQPFIAMEWIDGESLAQRLTASGTALPSPSCCGWPPRSPTLDAAHTSGVVHRDLKPAICSSRSGATRILDFGLARCRPLPRPPPATPPFRRRWRRSAS
jgi:serine/threonine protein kinase